MDRVFNPFRGKIACFLTVMREQRRAGTITSRKGLLVLDSRRPEEGGRAAAVGIIRRNRSEVPSRSLERSLRLLSHPTHSNSSRHRHRPRHLRPCREPSSWGWATLVPLRCGCLPLFQAVSSATRMGRLKKSARARKQRVGRRRRETGERSFQRRPRQRPR